MKRIKMRETQKHSLFGSMILRREIMTFYFLSLLRFDTSGTVKHLLVYIPNSHLISSRAFIQVRDTQRTACSTSDATSRDPSPLDGKTEVYLDLLILVLCNLAMLELIASSAHGKSYTEFKYAFWLSD